MISFESKNLKDKPFGNKKVALKTSFKSNRNFLHF